MKSFFREPLVHFFLIGAALFFAFSFIGDPASQQTGRIVVTPSQIEFLAANFTRTWQRQPTRQELERLTDSYIRDEIFYREALALGLDRDDQYIRRRLKQKLEFMSDDLARLVTPTTEQLRQYMASHPDKFRLEPRVAFRHIYLDVKRHGDDAAAVASELLEQLSRTKAASDPDAMGDSLMLPKSFDLLPKSEVARFFGEPFSSEILNVMPGSWAGPLRSAYGLHLVLVEEKDDGRQLELNEVREQVERDWLADRKKKQRERIYNSLREKYTVVFEAAAGKQKPIKAASEAQASEGILK